MLRLPVLKRTIPAALCFCIVVAGVRATYAESDAIIREAVPLPGPPAPVEIGQPLDLRPADITPAGPELKTVTVPLPPVLDRPHPAAGVATTPQSTFETASTPQPTATDLLRERLAAPLPGDTPLDSAQVTSYAPSQDTVPSAILQPSLNPAIPPLPGGGAIPRMQAPEGARTGSEDEEDENTPASVETQTDFVDVACLKPDLLRLIQQTGEFFKQIPIITSGYRARGRAGSYHRKCMAADFIVPGVSQQTLVAYLRHLPGAGGVGTYCHTKAVHLDIGEPRDWGYCGFRRTYFSLR